MINFVLLLLLFVLPFCLGIIISGYLFPTKKDGLFIAAASFILGNLVSIWAIYWLSVLSHSLRWGIIAGEVFLLVSIVWFWRGRTLRFSLKTISALQIGVLFFSVLISSWLMFKTFKSGPDSNLLIASNLVLDMGQAISLVRSMDWGNNIPYMSPFIASTVHIYHFLFYFWCAALESLGPSIVWAINIPSLLSFSAFLVVLFFLPQYLFGENVWYGLFAMILGLTHSTLTAWYFMASKLTSGNLLRSIWQNPKYFFAGPYDGSSISIFWTLNVFVNQRHLIFSIAAVLLLYLAVVDVIQKRRAALDGRLLSFVAVLSGLLIYWHMTLWLATLIIISLLFVFRTWWKETVMFSILSGAIGAAHIAPWLMHAGSTQISAIHSSIFHWFLSANPIDFLLYWWQNAGFLLIVTVIGVWIMPKKMRVLLAPYLVLFMMANTIRFTFDISENHKMINVVVFVADVLAAYTLVRCWKQKIIGKIFAVCLFITLTASGVIDGVVIKNDFLYPIQDAPGNHIIQYIQRQTASDAIFLSYQDIFDPVTIAGRKEYVGFYGAAAFPDRLARAKTLFELKNAQQITLFKESGIDYVMIPKWKKADFNYSVDLPFLRSSLTTVYEDDRNVLFRI